MKRTLPLFGILLIVLVSGCTQSTPGGKVITGPSTQCGFLYGEYNLSAVSFDEAEILSEGVRMSLQDMEAECTNISSSCQELKCTIMDAVRTDNESVCGSLPDKATVLPYCYNIEMLESQIERHFGLSPEEYAIESSECYFGRGSEYKTKGTTADGVPFELRHRNGLCSSGGSDCGEGYCLSVNPQGSDEFYQRILETACGEMGNESESCLSGEFEQVHQGNRVLSFYLVENRYESYLLPWDLDCYGEDVMEAVSPRNVCYAHLSWGRLEVTFGGCEMIQEMYGNLTDEISINDLKHNCYTNNAIRSGDEWYCGIMTTGPGLYRNTEYYQEKCLEILQRFV